MKTFKQFQEQMTPGQSRLPNDPDAVHIDLRKPGQKLRDLQLKRKEAA